MGVHLCPVVNVIHKEQQTTKQMRYQGVVLYCSIANGRLTFGHMPRIKPMNYVRVFLSHNFFYGGMPVCGDHFRINALIQDFLQAFPEAQWFHCNRTGCLGHLERTKVWV